MSNQEASHKHPWAEDDEGRCVLCGLTVARDQLERHMQGMAARIEQLTKLLLDGQVSLDPEHKTTWSDAVDKALRGTDAREEA